MSKLCAICGMSFNENQSLAHAARKAQVCCSRECGRQNKRKNWQKRFWSRVEKSTDTDCWFWVGAVQSNGYGHFPAKDALGNHAGAHRVSYFIASGKDPGSMHVLHRCDTPLCVNPAHLFLGTNSDNVADKVGKGRARGVAGEKHPNATISEAIVKEARRMSRCGLQPKKIATLLHVSVPAIRAAVANKSWRHVDE